MDNTAYETSELEVDVPQAEEATCEHPRPHLRPRRPRYATRAWYVGLSELLFIGFP